EPAAIGVLAALDEAADAVGAEREQAARDALVLAREPPAFVPRPIRDRLARRAADRRERRRRLGRAHGCAVAGSAAGVAARSPPDPRVRTRYVAAPTTRH